MFSCSLLHFKKKLCLWNARFHLALSFCAPLPCCILPHKLSVLFTIAPFFPLRTMYVFSSSTSLHPFLCIHPFVWCSLWHLCHARLWGREGRTGLTIVTGQTHEISIVLFLSRWTVLASNLWWCQPPFSCALYMILLRSLVLSTRDSAELYWPFDSSGTSSVQFQQDKFHVTACKITCHYCWYDNSFPNYRYC